MVPIDLGDLQQLIASAPGLAADFALWAQRRAEKPPKTAADVELLKRLGVPLLVLATQVSAVPLMKQWTKPQDHYVEITLHDNVTILFAESRSLLERIGIAGEILPTPGHSDDSVSLLLDDGAAFTGDLTPLPLVGKEDADVVAASWRRLEEHGAARVYPGHGPVRSAANTVV